MLIEFWIFFMVLAPCLTTQSRTAPSPNLELIQVCTGKPLNIVCPTSYVITVTKYARIVGPVYGSMNQCMIRSSDMTCCQRHCADVDEVIGRNARVRAESCSNQTTRCYRESIKTSGYCTTESYKTDQEQVWFTCTANGDSSRGSPTNAPVVTRMTPTRNNNCITLQTKKSDHLDIKSSTVPTTNSGGDTTNNGDQLTHVTDITSPGVHQHIGCTGSPFRMSCPVGQHINVTNYGRITGPIVGSMLECENGSRLMTCCRRHCLDVEITARIQARAASCTGQTVCIGHPEKTTSQCPTRSIGSYKSDQEEIQFTCIASSVQRSTPSSDVRAPIRRTNVDHVVTKSPSSFLTPVARKSPTMTSLHQLESNELERTVPHDDHTMSSHQEQNMETSQTGAVLPSSIKDSAGTHSTLLVVGIVAALALLVGVVGVVLTYSRHRRNKMADDNPAGVECAAEFHSLDGASQPIIRGSHGMSQSSGHHAKPNIYEITGKAIDDETKDVKLGKELDIARFVESIYEDIELTK